MDENSQGVARTKVVNIRHGESYDVLIDRWTKWGNPYRVGIDGTREECVTGYRFWIKRQPELLASLGELKGKRLGCWCVPLLCHGQVLVELIGEG